MGHEPAQLTMDRVPQAATIVVTATPVDVNLVAPVESLLEQALEAEVRELEIDSSEVSFADSSVLHVPVHSN